MRTRLLVSLAILSSPTVAGDDQSGSKRVCDDATYATLVAAKVNACDRVGPMKCNQNTSCAEIPGQIIKLNACTAARQAIMDKCFPGGDSGHNEQVRNLRRAIDNCFELLERCRKKDESCKE